MAGPKRGSGTRSNSYSEDKYTNRARFDPFTAEANRASRKRWPDGAVKTDSGVVPIYESELQAGFLRPFSVDDVAETLSQVPAEYLEGLEAIFLLGGTAKQRRARRFSYGMYYGYHNRICLHALAEGNLVQWWDPPPKPSVAREFTRFGASFERESGGWVLRFTPESLRLFYLFDVLLHEVGHHVERNVHRFPCRASERYATWFANYQSVKLLKGDREPEL